MEESGSIKRMRAEQPELPVWEDNSVFRELVAVLKGQAPEQRERRQQLVNHMADEQGSNES